MQWESNPTVSLRQAADLQQRSSSLEFQDMKSLTTRTAATSTVHKNASNFVALRGRRFTLEPLTPPLPAPEFPLYAAYP